MKTGQIPRIDQVYENFKAYVADRREVDGRACRRPLSLLEALGDARLRPTDDDALRDALADLAQLKVDVAFPS